MTNPLTVRVPLVTCEVMVIDVYTPVIEATRSYVVVVLNGTRMPTGVAFGGA